MSIIEHLDNWRGCRSYGADPHGGHSRKFCWCGGHNHRNAKSNLNHHGTRMRYLHRVARLARLKECG